jgi:mannose/fructose-specific phosphotransferase system component IIA
MDGERNKRIERFHGIVIFTEIVRVGVPPLKVEVMEYLAHVGQNSKEVIEGLELPMLVELVSLEHTIYLTLANR